LTCPENYEKVKNISNLEYVCEPKACEDRSPKENGLCSLKEDFTGGSTVECYYLKTENSERCVNQNECPTGLGGVIYIFIIFFLFRGYNFLIL
jgi:hypothetical protein